MRLTDYTAWARAQVASYEAAFDARLAAYMRNPASDISPEALLRFAHTLYPQRNTLP